MYSVFFCRDRKDRDEHNYYIEYYAGTVETYEEAREWVHYLDWGNEQNDHACMYYAYLMHEEFAPLPDAVLDERYDDVAA